MECQEISVGQPNSLFSVESSNSDHWIDYFLLTTSYFLAHCFWLCVITILAPTLKMTEKHISSLNSSLRLEIAHPTGWVLGMIDKWFLYLTHLWWPILIFYKVFLDSTGFKSMELEKMRRCDVHAMFTWSSTQSIEAKITDFIGCHLCKSLQPCDNLMTLQSQPVQEIFQHNYFNLLCMDLV